MLVNLKCTHIQRKSKPENHVSVFASCESRKNVDVSIVSWVLFALRLNGNRVCIRMVLRQQKPISASQMKLFGFNWKYSSSRWRPNELLGGVHLINITTSVNRDFDSRHGLAENTLEFVWSWFALSSDESIRCWYILYIFFNLLAEYISINFRQTPLIQA